MKTVKDVKARMRPGTRLVCANNTYRPEMSGKERVVVKAGPSVVMFEVDGKANYRMEWKAGVKILDADTFVMPMDHKGIERLAGHSVTLRFLDGASESNEVMRSTDAR